jgi:hypothetical protein
MRKDLLPWLLIGGGTGVVTLYVFSVHAGGEVFWAGGWLGLGIGLGVGLAAGVGGWLLYRSANRRIRAVVLGALIVALSIAVVLLQRRVLGLL